MTTQRKTALVTGATGKQGGEVARQLQAKGWQVRALTRDLNQPAAQALAARGVELVQGDFDDRAALDRALQGVSGVFSVQASGAAGADAQIRQGKALADAAKAAKVEHLVYSGVGGAERHTGIPFWDSKWEIEQHIRALGLPATMLRPVSFMENYNAPNNRSAILGGSLRNTLRPDRPLQLVAVEDIGTFAVLAFENPGEYAGKAIELAGDELTMLQAAEAFSRVLGRPVRYEQQPLDQSQARTAAQWLNEAGYQADIPALRAIHPGLLTLEAWLRKAGWDKAE